MIAERGFTYIGILIAIAVMGIGLAAVGAVTHTAQMREKERELLFVGDQFRRAIAMYYERAPGGIRTYPKKLEDLLLDTRYPSVHRHLRKIYADPMTGKKEWGLVEMPGVGIIGVHSLSDQAPLKTAKFPAPYQSFSTAKKHSDWKFVHVPAQQIVQPPAPPGRMPPAPMPR
jgi:type II secretory pathway pseudopilin PulG